jgi:DNA-binding LytR/AlgR family response regulator
MHSNPILNKLKEEITSLLITGISIFLFILFFQPFPLEYLAYYTDRLLYVTGFGVITFIITTIIIIIPLSIPRWFKNSEPESISLFILNILLFVLTFTAFTFYIRFVGKTDLSLYIMFKTGLISVFPTTILLIINKNKVRNELIKILQEQNKIYLTKLNTYEEIEEPQEVEIISSNRSDKIILNFQDLLLLKSADNYVEVFYKKSGKLEKKLIRNTLKNIEDSLKKSKCFIRCHRTSVVNILHIKNLTGNYKGYNLTIHFVEEKIPVSRQYLTKVKEAFLQAQK